MFETETIHVSVGELGTIFVRIGNAITPWRERQKEKSKEKKCVLQGNLSVFPSGLCFVVSKQQWNLDEPMVATWCGWWLFQCNCANAGRMPRLQDWLKRNYWGFCQGLRQGEWWIPTMTSVSLRDFLASSLHGLLWTQTFIPEQPNFPSISHNNSGKYCVRGYSKKMGSWVMGVGPESLEYVRFRQ